uniref:Quinate transporter n=1 Tax=Cyberlindnera americana TaxID=36016 RepID=A0A5P8N8I8_9ASCO|nr:MFS transporter [Cyberlindnera americana]
MKFTIHNPFKVVEDRPTPPQVYNWKVYACGIVLAAAALEIGYDSGFIGGTLALDSFASEFGLDQMTTSHHSFITSNIISVFHAGCFFGSIFSYFFTYYKGRKFGLLFSCVTMALGAILMMLPSHSRGLVPLYLGRTLAGVGVGCSTSIVPVYLAEISPPGIRGRVSAMYELGWRVGDTTGFFIAYGVSDTIKESFKQWYIPFAVQLIPAGLYIIGVSFLIETPRWLVGKGRDEEALKNLCWLRNLNEEDEYIQWEFNNMKEEIEVQKRTVGLGFTDPFRELARKPSILKRLFISAGLYVLQDLYGIQSINYYSPTIFKQIGVKSTNTSLFSSGLFGVCKLISTIIWAAFVVEQFGRRTTLLFTSPICALCFFYIGGYVKYKTSGPEAKAALGLVYVWCFFFIMGWSGTPYVVGAEIFDNNIRGACQAINSMFLWLGVFLMTRFTTQMVASMKYGLFFFFAGFAVLSIPFVYFLLPETKGVSLEYMDRLFAKPAWRAHKELFEELDEERLERERVDGLGSPLTPMFTQDDVDEKASAEFVEEASIKRSGV